MLCNFSNPETDQKLIRRACTQFQDGENFDFFLVSNKHFFSDQFGKFKRQRPDDSVSFFSGMRDTVYDIDDVCRQILARRDFDSLVRSERMKRVEMKRFHSRRETFSIGHGNALSE